MKIDELLFEINAIIFPIMGIIIGGIFLDQLMFTAAMVSLFGGFITGTLYFIANRMPDLSRRNK